MELTDRRSGGPQMGAREWLLLVALSILWGGSFFFGEVALRDFPPFTVVFGRVALAALALNILLRIRGHTLPSSLRDWGPFAVMGVLNNLLPFSLIFWGQTQIASGLAAILNATTPIFTIVLAHFLTDDERMTPNKAVGVLIGIVGVVLLVGPSAVENLGLNILGQIAVLGAACSYAFAGIFGRRFSGTPALVTATGQVTATSILMVPIVLVRDQPWTLAAPEATTVAAIVALGLFSTALAYIIYFRLLAAAGATNLLLVTLLIPLSALALGALILNEALRPYQLLGMAVLGMGLIVIDGRLFRSTRSWFRRA